MKLRKFITLVVILAALYLSATTVTSNNDGIRAIGFVTGVVFGSIFGMWLNDNL